MDFEYDPAKSASNKVKHGIDFDEASLIWKDARVKSSLLDSRIETRYLLVGKLDEKLWSVIYTHRNERIRIISARPSRSGEIDGYENG
jgi:uncharacterized DUF497 family protein